MPPVHTLHTVWVHCRLDRCRGSNYADCRKLMGRSGGGRQMATPTESGEWSTYRCAPLRLASLPFCSHILSLYSCPRFRSCAAARQLALSPPRHHMPRWGSSRLTGERTSWRPLLELTRRCERVEVEPPRTGSPINRSTLLLPSLVRGDVETTVIAQSPRQGPRQALQRTAEASFLPTCLPLLSSTAISHRPPLPVVSLSHCGKEEDGTPGHSAHRRALPDA